MGLHANERFEILVQFLEFTFIIHEATGIFSFVELYSRIAPSLFRAYDDDVDVCSVCTRTVSKIIIKKENSLNKEFVG